MSGPQGETSFDESVFDAPEPEAAEKPAEAQAEAKEAAKAPDPKSQIETTAQKIGWAGKDDWKGDPADWIDAPDFILKAAGEVLPSMRKSLDEAKSEIKSLKSAVNTSIKHLGKARQEGYEQRSRELQAELARFAEAGDVASVKAVTQDIVALEKEVRDEPEVTPEKPTEPPEFTAWKDDNAWFGKDKALTAAAAALGEEAVADGYSGKALIKEVDRRLREEFPAKFAKPSNPNRALAGAVEGGGQARRSAGKSFSDMPREHQDMCLDLMKQSKSITKEAYAREFFAEEKR